MVTIDETVEKNSGLSDKYKKTIKKITTGLAIGVFSAWTAIAGMYPLPVDTAEAARKPAKQCGDIANWPIFNPEGKGYNIAKDSTPRVYVLPFTETESLNSYLDFLGWTQRDWTSFYADMIKGLTQGDPGKLEKAVQTVDYLLNRFHYEEKLSRIDSTLEAKMQSAVVQKGGDAVRVFSLPTFAALRMMLQDRLYECASWDAEKETMVKFDDNANKVLEYFVMGRYHEDIQARRINLVVDVVNATTGLVRNSFQYSAKNINRAVESLASEIVNSFLSVELPRNKIWMEPLDYTENFNDAKETCEIYGPDWRIPEKREMRQLLGRAVKRNSFIYAVTSTFSRLQDSQAKIGIWMTDKGYPAKAVYNPIHYTWGYSGASKVEGNYTICIKQR